MYSAHNRVHKQETNDLSHSHAKGHVIHDYYYKNTYSSPLWPLLFSINNGVCTIARNIINYWS